VTIQPPTAEDAETIRTIQRGRSQDPRSTRTGLLSTTCLRDEAAAEIGREQPGCLHELIGHDYGDGFRGQQAKQN
jgi:hypothetical protein